MNRILIIGGNGSGKTTLARALSKELSLPLFHLDRMYWLDGWQHVSREELAARLAPVLESPRWIIDGNMKHSLRKRLEYCDTVIYLDFPGILCAWGTAGRLLRFLNKSRPDMGGECIERLDRRSLAFILSTFSFNRKNRQDFYTWIGESKHAQCIVLKNRRQVRRFAASLRQAH